MGVQGVPPQGRPAPSCEFSALLVLQSLDTSLLQVNALISQDERISANPVARIVYGDPAAFLPGLPRRGALHCSKAWSCRQKVTVQHLQHVLEQKNGKETVPILWYFLQQVRAPWRCLCPPMTPRP